MLGTSSSPRLAQARDIIRRKAKVVGESGLLDLFYVLNWFDQVHYDEEGILQLRDLGDLQTVALAGALVAYAEGVR
ncbi:hypothetical protein LCGC14_1088670 [marine sediment metagenome]|uniref:Uncharacterized protein n=1 Tax=marine sediment metagenome TaxID=412755 RepID=A0A0F9MHJ3_9ZZZZ